MTAYNYAGADPINRFDPAGLCWGGGNWCNPSKWNWGAAKRAAAKIGGALLGCGFGTAGGAETASVGGEVIRHTIRAGGTIGRAGVAIGVAGGGLMLVGGLVVIGVVGYALCRRI